MKVPVLLPNIFDHPFTYTSKEKLKIGDYVEVPFGKKKMIGIIWNDFEEEPKKKFKIKKFYRYCGDRPFIMTKDIRFYLNKNLNSFDMITNNLAKKKIDGGLTYEIINFNSLKKIYKFFFSVFFYKIIWVFSSR